MDSNIRFRNNLTIGFWLVVDGLKEYNFGVTDG
jgi:hypothetical protein